MLDKYPVITKLACVALAVSFVLPAGDMLFPLIGDWIGATPFNAIEAVLSTSLGFGAVFDAVRLVSLSQKIMLHQ